MKKAISLLLTCLLGTVTSWAETTLIYGRALQANADAGIAAWSADDIATTAWNGNATYNETYGIYMSGSGNRTTSQTFTITENSIVAIDIEWNTLTNTGNASNYSYLRIGSNIEIQSNQQNQTGSVIINGNSSAISNANLKNGNNRNNDVWSIHIEINTALSKLNELTLTGSLGTNKASYSLPEAVTLQNGISGSLPVTLGINRAGGTPNTALQTISIYEEQQQVSTAGYTINYQYGGDTIKTVASTTSVGNIVYAESPIKIDGTKYYAADGSTTSLTVTSNTTANVLNVNLRQAETSTVAVNAMSGSTLLKTFSGTRTEGEDASYLYYTRAVKYEGKYYTVPAANANGVNYGVSMAHNATAVNKEYTLDESIAYYAEESELNLSRSYAAQGNAAERASGGNWQRLYSGAHAYTAPLAGGVYSIDVSARSQSANSNTLQIAVRNSDGTLGDAVESLTWGNSINSVQTVSNITVPEGASIAIVNPENYNSNIAIDYVIVRCISEDISIGSAGVSSYVTTSALDFTETDGLTALVATEETATEIQLTKVTKVPAGTPVIVLGTAGTTYSVPTGECSELSTGKNLLSGFTDREFNVGSEAATPVYALKTTDGDFHHVAANVTIPAKKAFLISQYGTSLEAKSVTIAGEIEDDPTAVTVNAADTEEDSAKLYDAAGRQVGAAHKGFVIDEKGKKYIK